MPKTYEPIQTITANGSASTFTFSSIPQTYTDLVIIANTINGQSGGFMYATFNSDTSSNYSRTFFYGAATTAASGRTTSSNRLDGGGTNPDGAFVKWDIFNYSNTTTFKTVILQHMEATRLMAAMIGIWRASPAAISTIEITAQAALYSGQTLTLYGIKAA
jgi:hypothetical protein